MTKLNIVQQRLYNQHIGETRFAKPEAVVQWLGAVQAQDYAAAKWALGLRVPGTIDEDIEQAYNTGTILRTHLMRPTWHFVSPTDIRWLLALTAPRIKAASAYWYRKLELDDASFRSSNAVLAKALQGGKQLTRLELMAILRQAGVAADDLGRFTYIMMRAELDGVVCSGARRGKQFTYALFDERVPQVQAFDHNEALSELAGRYFISHGPATLQDFVWWSGLTTTDARAGLAMVTSQLTHEVADGQTYWFSTSTPPTQALPQTVYILPNFDEYIVGYQDRSAVFDVSHTQKLDQRGNILFNHTIVLDGRVVGTWKRTLKKDAVVVTPCFFTPLNAAERHAFTAAVNRYATFLAKSMEPVTVQQAGQCSADTSP